jgi:hypothetical protein
MRERERKRKEKGNGGKGKIGKIGKRAEEEGN